MIPFCIGGLLFVGAIMRRTKKLDAMFVPLGLEGSAYLSFFRQYHGTVHGRQVAVYLRRGPILEIEIATPIRTRLGITEHQSDTSFFADMAGQKPLVLTDPDLAALTVFALDEAWARSLLTNTTATDALRRLTALGSTIFTRQQVILRPETLKLMLTGNRKLFGIDINAEQARLWVDDLIRVVFGNGGSTRATDNRRTFLGRGVRLRAAKQEPVSRNLGRVGNTWLLRDYQHHHLRCSVLFHRLGP